MLNIIKQFLPASSRSLHAMHDDINRLREELDRIYHRIEVADSGINMNINYKFDNMAIPIIESIAQNLDAHDEHMKIFAWEEYKRPEETIQEAKERFFKDLPKATGGLRLLQLGCGKLLEEFNTLCKENDINYWINFGTLIGAIRHQGFIPWDDDTDLGIMRDDLNKLYNIVEDDNRYRISIAYDRFAHCRQVRFLYNDENIPCFLDLFIYDWATSTDNKFAEEQRKLRVQMVEKMESDRALAFWNDEPYYSGENNSLIQKHYDRCLEKSKAARIICEKEHAKGIIWAIDNLDDGKQKQWVYPIADLFPTKAIAFEGTQLEEPNNPDLFLWSRYGDIYELPNDINSHFQHVNHNELENGSSNLAMKRLLD